jgi:acyl carrier protein
MPLTHTERLIASELSSLLKRPLDPISGDTTFAELGLDSLTGVRLMARLEEVLGRKLDPMLAWDHDDVGGFAAAIDAAASQEPEATDEPAGQP